MSEQAQLNLLSYREKHSKDKKLMKIGGLVMNDKEFGRDSSVRLCFLLLR